MSKFLKPEADLELDAVSYYNEYQKEHAAKVLIKVAGATMMDIDTYKIPADADVYFNGQSFIAHAPNEAGMIPGKAYTPFMLMSKFKFDLNFNAAVMYVEQRFRGAKSPYIRVGTDYFKVIHTIDRFGIRRTELKRWKKEEIKQDYGNAIIKTIPLFDAFINNPDNIDHNPTPLGLYNLYSPFSHKPAEKDSPWPWTETLMRHVFGDQYDKGLKYMQVLYLHPTQALPILVLASKARSTGKTTFLNWMAQIFGANYTVITPQEFTSGFNGSYATSNIIGIEETEDDKRSTVHKIKALSTNKFLTVNQKFIEQYKLPFYGKFIITTNEPDNFLRIDSEEIRFWVRELTDPKNNNTNIEKDLVAEIPAFLRFLQTLPPVDFSRSRAVFTPEEIQTDALSKVKFESRSGLHKDIDLCVDQYFLENPDARELELTVGDIKDIFFPHNARIEQHYIQKVVTKEMGLSSVFKRYTPINDPLVSKPGRVYVFKRKEDELW